MARGVVKVSDLNQITSENLLYEYSVLGTTIHDKIESIVSTIDPLHETISATGADLVYNLANAVDTAMPYSIFVNGSNVREGASYDYTLSAAGVLTFAYLVETGLAIEVYYYKG